MNIPIPQLKKWIAALDSGEYKQGQHHLQTQQGYCCLGVACKILIPQNKLTTKFGTSMMEGRTPSAQFHAPEWLKLIDDDFDAKTGEHLFYLNDGHMFTFPEIATLLELVYIHKILD